MIEQAPIAERLDALAERAQAEIRSPALRALFVDLLAIVGEIDARKPETAPGTGITPAQLEQAIGGVAFLGNLGGLLERIDRARAEDVNRVVDYIFRTPPPGPAP